MGPQFAPYSFVAGGDFEPLSVDRGHHLTLIADKRAPDHVYSALEKEFSKEEQVSLTLLINVINGWNRLAVSFGLYNPKLGW